MGPARSTERRRRHAPDHPVRPGDVGTRPPRRGHRIAHRPAGGRRPVGTDRGRGPPRRRDARPGRDRDRGHLRRPVRPERERRPSPLPRSRPEGRAGLARAVGHGEHGPAAVRRRRRHERQARCRPRCGRRPRDHHRRPERRRGGDRRRHRLQPSGPRGPGLDEPGRIGRRQGDGRDRQRRQRLRRRRPRLGLLPQRQHRPRRQRRLPRHARRRHDRGSARRRRAWSGSPRRSS